MGMPREHVCTRQQHHHRGSRLSFQQQIPLQGGQPLSALSKVPKMPLTCSTQKAANSSLTARRGVALLYQLMYLPTEWDVETGSSKKVARASHSPVVSNTTVIPTIIRSAAMVMSVVGNEPENTEACNKAYQECQQTLVAWQCHS